MPRESDQSLVIGGTGLVGGYIVSQLQGRGKRPLVLSRAERTAPGIDWVRGDLRDPASLRLPEFATLKAMGYSDRYLAGVVLKQALLLAVVGFIPGVLLSGLMYLILGLVTGLPLLMTPPRAGTVLLLTILMCSASGVLTVRKLRSADPADLF